MWWLLLDSFAPNREESRFDSSRLIPGSILSSRVKLQKTDQPQIGLSSAGKVAGALDDGINEYIQSEKVKYDVVTDYGKLMDVVGLKEAANG